MINIRKCFAIVLILVTYCIDSYAEGKVKFNSSGIISMDNKNMGLLQPEGIGCSNPSILLVADAGNGRLVQYSFDNEIIVPMKEIRVPQVSYPIRAQVTSKGEILALDGKTRRIARISPTGDFIAYLDLMGVPQSENIVPRSFALDTKDRIYILDIFSERVLLLETSGKFLKEILFSKKPGFVSDISVDASENVYLIDSISGDVYFSAKDSKNISILSKGLKEYCDFPVSLSSDNRGHIYVVDKNGSRIVVLGRDGSFQGQQLSMGWKEGFLRYPSHICVNNKGKIFIADTGNNRIQTFTVFE